MTRDVDLAAVAAHYASVPADPWPLDAPPIDNSRASELLDDFRENRAHATRLLMGDN